MARTPVRGITIDGLGRRTVDKEHRGERIFTRLGAVSQEEAERYLAKEIDRLEWERERRIHARPLFSDCAKRFLRESKHKRSATTLAWHIELLVRYIGDLEVHRVHDDTLRPLIDARLAEGVSATTINRTLEVARTILHRAARAYRDDDGMPWLELAPPLITMLPEDPRPPYPISWDEQERIFRRLPDHLAHMALFAVNTGLRDSNLCGLRWSWEVPIAQLGRSVFVIPREAFKSRRPHVVILNHAAWSIVESRRGKHADWVFTFRGKPVQTMNNTAWQRARRNAELSMVRIHDLRHTFATRLRAAGVHEEDRAALLGHAWRSMPEHYASADVRRLIDLANRVLDRSAEAVTILRVANGWSPSPTRQAALSLCG
jgi:integrase